VVAAAIAQSSSVSARGVGIYNCSEANLCGRVAMTSYEITRCAIEFKCTPRLPIRFASVGFGDCYGVPHDAPGEKKRVMWRAFAEFGAPGLRDFEALGRA